jgi:hypothetical protein
MKCLRCGKCCGYLVAVVKNPTKVKPDEDFTGDFDENNVITLSGGGIPCPHLMGCMVGEYSCAIHHYPWYKHTPCFAHSQFETEDSNCRVGEWILNKFKKGELIGKNINASRS